ncbi:nucleotide-binding universal stress UspA family protein [Roseospira goensis]|uniref:Nucleotide-binding universal stress UspA family protein n=2 Tax=Roseospira goensis TaxID=391922 RepID=A0A7W6RZW8_9PROT|nr:nucleotide-binding universal stress UspA family protein [Roseospira goensis]
MATDLSPRSDRALDRAVALARGHDADLCVVHVVDEDLPASVAEAQETAARDVMRAHIDSLNKEAAVPVSIEVVIGRTYVDVLEMAERIEADLIILGTHREDSVMDMFRGTTAERIIRAGDTPVLLVRDRVLAPYRRIMVAVDFSVYSRRAFEFATRFDPRAEFHLVHAYEVPFKGFLYGHTTRREVSKQHERQLQSMIEEEMAAFLGTLETKVPRLERVLQEGSPQEVIRRQVTRLKPDLLVLGTHGRTGVAHAILGSVAEDLLKAPPCDVLAVKAW